MQTKIMVLILTLLLSSCAFVQKKDIEQGNIITPDSVNRLHRGMNKAQVQEIMGTPTLINTFNDNRINYVYTFKPGGGMMHEKQVTLIFTRQGVLNEIIQREYNER